MNPQTEQRLREIEEREQKATKGTWRMFPDEETEMVHVTHATPETDNDAASTLADCFNFTFYEDTSNGDFIAHARADIPFLIALVRKQWEALDEISYESAYHAEHGDGDVGRLAKRCRALIKQANNFNPDSAHD